MFVYLPHVFTQIYKTLFAEKLKTLPQSPGYHPSAPKNSALTK